MEIPTSADILRARAALRPHILHTPLRPSPYLSSLGTPAWLKLDHWQPTGSFKVRGATNFILNTSPSERERGMVTASAGNHGLATAYAAQRLGLANVTIYVPRTAPRAKVDKLRLFPVSIVETGDTYDDAHHAAELYRQETGATFLHAYDDPRTVAGAGTIGFEILDDLPEIETILVPVGGGGLISGVALAVKAVAPQVQVLGVQPDASPALADSLRDGKVYEEYPATPTIADGLAGGIGRICFEVAQRLVDDVIVVRESEIHAAVRVLVSREQLLVEGSGAASVAALLFHADRLKGRRTVAILTGANLDPSTLKSCLDS